MFDGERGSTCLAEDAKPLRNSVPALQGNIEDLDEIGTDIMLDPLIEDCAQKLAELQGFNRPFRNLAGTAPARTDQVKTIRPGCTGDPFNDGDELHVATADFTKETINRQRVIG